MCPQSITNGNSLSNDKTFLCPDAGEQVLRPHLAKDINTDASTGKPCPVQPKADFSLKGLDPDPGHEFPDVQQQLAAANPARVMNCFSPAQLPVLNQLAAEFAVCDSWFSSLPGPTWPNRFFMMAATSGGLTKSPTTGDIIKATTLQGYGFQHGNIFDALDKNGIPWCIVEGDLFPVSFALKGMDENSVKGRFVGIIWNPSIRCHRARRFQRG
jgi:phospholipase C